MEGSFTSFKTMDELSRRGRELRQQAITRRKKKEQEAKEGKEQEDLDSRQRERPAIPTLRLGQDHAHRHLRDHGHAESEAEANSSSAEESDMGSGLFGDSGEEEEDAELDAVLAGFRAGNKNMQHALGKKTSGSWQLMAGGKDSYAQKKLEIRNEKLHKLIIENVPKASRVDRVTDRISERLDGVKYDLKVWDEMEESQAVFAERQMEREKREREEALIATKKAVAEAKSRGYKKANAFALFSNTMKARRDEESVGLDLEEEVRSKLIAEEDEEAEAQKEKEKSKSMAQNLSTIMGTKKFIGSLQAYRRATAARQRRNKKPDVKNIKRPPTVSIFEVHPSPSSLYTCFNQAFKRTTKYDDTKIRTDIAHWVSRSSGVEELLGISLNDYTAACTLPGHFGGAFEIAFLSIMYNVDVVVVDARTVLTMHIEFSIECPRCIYLVWDGCYYNLVWNDTADEAFFESGEDMQRQAILKACAIWVGVFIVFVSI